MELKNQRVITKNSGYMENTFQHLPAPAVAREMNISGVEKTLGIVIE